MVTDYDCWHPGHDAVTVEQVVKVLLANADKAKALIQHAAPRFPAVDDCALGCRHALDTAIITAPEARDAEMIARLDAVAGRVLGK
jgi:5'-methylthioadenosine phosphorylase